MCSRHFPGDTFASLSWVQFLMSGVLSVYGVICFHKLHVYGSFSDWIYAPDRSFLFDCLQSASSNDLRVEQYLLVSPDRERARIRSLPPSYLQYYPYVLPESSEWKIGVPSRLCNVLQFNVTIFRFLKHICHCNGMLLYKLFGAHWILASFNFFRCRMGNPGTLLHSWD